jgi:sigma-B regulation protein RsbQ
VTNSATTGQKATEVGEVDVLARNAVTLAGDPALPPMVFGPGYGTSQKMWRLVAPQFADQRHVVLFDHVGSGDSDVSAYDRRKYDSLRGYAADLLEIIRTLDLHDVVFVGHSVYVGGFERDDVDGLLDALEVNHASWATAMAPALMQNSDRPELAAELAQSMARTDTMVAQHFARVTFLSDLRRFLKDITVPTLILQSSDDLIAPLEVGEYLRENIRDSELVVLNAAGHYAHLSDPAEIERQIRRCL